MIPQPNAIKPARSIGKRHLAGAFSNSVFRPQSGNSDLVFRCAAWTLVESG